MGEKYLPFYARFHDPIRAGVKTHTLRSKRYGDPGDLLASPVGRVRLLSVKRATPAWVRDNLWEQEGCSGPDDFTAVWLAIHPKAPRWNQERWLHHFEWVGNGPREALDA